MKESLRHIDNRIVFRETFDSEFITRKIGGVPTNVSYSKGVGEFDGTGNIIYPNITSDTYSIRIKFNQVVIETAYLLDFSDGGGSGQCYILNNNGGLSSGAAVGTFYVDGVIGSTITADSKEIILTGTDIISVLESLTVGSRYNASFKSSSNIELIEIYKGTLTASEVKNLYNNKTYHELPDKTDTIENLLDVSTLKGVLEDRMGNILTPTDIAIKQIGSGIYSPDFNGSTSKIDCGDFNSLIGDITAMGWVNKLNAGEDPNNARLIDNGKFILNYTLNALMVISDGATFITTPVGSMPSNKYLFIAVTRTASGIVNLYIGDIKTAPILSGGADRDSGTPVAGTTNIFIGNRSGSDKTFNGKIPRTTIYTGIASLEQITQFFSNTKRYFE